MRRFFLTALALAGAMALSCSGENETAILWADRPEFAFYGGYFNAAQSQYRVEVRYFDSPAEKLREAGSMPDIVAGSWLKSASTRVFFRPLDSLLRSGGLSNGAFYPRLLEMGNIDGRQYLLPVSFNAPVVIFARDKGMALSNPFTAGFDE
ncbi:MAG: hypothetical protein LBD48_08600, partial [Treponema sp.]|nr:hypothetical protein [Treponema sp.]